MGAPKSLARCSNVTEPNGILCQGILMFVGSDAQAKCPTCGGWTGRGAPSVEWLDDLEPTLSEAVAANLVTDGGYLMESEDVAPHAADILAVLIPPLGLAERSRIAAELDKKAAQLKFCERQAAFRDTANEIRAARVATEEAAAMVRGVA